MEVKGKGGAGEEGAKAEEEKRAGFEELSEEVVEQILARLPLQWSLAAASVCKPWRTLVSSSSFLRQLAAQHFGHRPWFFLAGVNHFLAAKNQAFGYDPESDRWRRFPAFVLPPYDQGSLTGTNGLLFALAGTGICKLGYTRCLMKNSSWRETPPLLFSRRSPIVAIVAAAPGASSAASSQHHHRLVVAGGKSLLDRLVVEIYDSRLDSWQHCAPLPPQFRSSSQWMCSAVFLGKFLAYETHTGFVASLDLDRRLWSDATLLRPQGTVYAFLVACRDSLVLAGLCRARNRPCFKLWTVDLCTLKCTELCQMPDDLFALFDEDDDEKDPLLSCVGDGDFIYLYSDSWHKDYLACLCDLSGGRITWRKMPALPAPVNRFDKVVCFSSSIMPDACL